MAGAELVFSVPLEILGIEDTYTIHDNEAVLSLVHIKPFLLQRLATDRFALHLPVNEVT